MTLFHAIVLAIVQGLTEFLPVSSSAHLIVIPWLLHWKEGGLAFDVALHAGTLAALVLYFLGMWIQLILNGLGMHYPAQASAAEVALNRRLFWLLVLGTIPGAIVGYLFEKKIEDALQTPIPIAWAMIAMGLLMWAADKLPTLTRHLKEANVTDSVFVGCAQALALFPGVSRSGITISASLARHFTREAAARFSFLLATPIIAGAAAKELPALIHQQRAGILDISTSTIVIAILVSAIVGYAVIAFFLRYLQTRTLNIFIVYRIAFGIVVLLLAYFQPGFAR